jgi:G-patch domain
MRITPHIQEKRAAVACPQHKGDLPLDQYVPTQEDVARLPDEADEAAYEAMPIEEFGAAMLRGMGWSEGQVKFALRQFSM